MIIPPKSKRFLTNLREGFRYILWLWRATFTRYNAISGPHLSGSLAFNSILSLVPMLTVVLTVLSAYPDLSKASILFRQYIETELLPNTGSKVIANYLFEFSKSAGKLGGAGLFFLGVTTLILLNRIEGALNKVWHISRPRPIKERMVNYWVAITIGPLAIGAVFYLMYQSLSVSFGLLGYIGMGFSLVKSVMSKALSIFLMTILIAFIYISLPNRKVNIRLGLFGALFTAIIIDILQRGFELYLSYFPSFTLIYGAFATIPIFLVWVFLCWQVFVMGACLVAAMDEGRQAYPVLTVSATEETPKTLNWDQVNYALQILGYLWQAFVSGESAQGSMNSKPPQPKETIHKSLINKLMAYLPRPRKKVAPTEGATTAFLCAQLALPIDEARLCFSVLKAQGFIDCNEEGVWLLSAHPESITGERLRNALFAHQSALPIDTAAWMESILRAPHLLSLIVPKH